MIPVQSLQRRARVLAVLGCLASFAAVAAPRPVVLELFTSNSCSSCPPAYALLRDLQARPPVDDVELIVLSQHVDYWNQLDWVDRFSSARFTQRQRDYAREVFGSNRVYTPQLVVNGRDEMVGSRRAEVQRAIARAADTADLGMSVKATPVDADTLEVSARVDGGRLEAPATVWFVLTRDNVVSHIGAGENGGRKLIENGVVISLRQAGRRAADAAAARHYSARLPRPRDVDADDLSVVVFVQQDNDLAIVGAAQAGLGAGHTASR